MSEDAPDVDVPEGFEVGSIDDATVDTEATERVWVEDEDDGKAYWFELKSDVPLRKKDNLLEDNVTTTQTDDGEVSQNVSADYYYEMLEYMKVDWFGAYEDDAESFTVFLNKASTVFDSLKDEVPPPFGSLDETESGN